MSHKFNLLDACSDIDTTNHVLLGRYDSGVSLYDYKGTTVALIDGWFFPLSVCNKTEVADRTIHEGMDFGAAIRDVLTIPSDEGKQK